MTKPANDAYSRRPERALVWDSTRPRPGFAAAGVGFVSFLVTELMHALLVPDIGRRWERLLAEGVSALVVGLLTCMLMKSVNRHRAATLLRWQVISDMNQHVRTALADICMTLEAIPDQPSVQRISQDVDHIDWALKEILLRPVPLPERVRSATEKLEGSRLPPRSDSQHLAGVVRPPRGKKINDPNRS